MANYSPRNDAFGFDDHQNTYAHETSPDLKNQIPVQKDNDVEDPIDPEYADSDEQLARDDKNAIDRSNIIGQTLRHAKPQTENKYNEGPDEDDLPVEDA